MTYFVDSMKLKQKLKNIVLTAGIVAGLVGVVAPTTTLAVAFCPDSTDPGKSVACTGNNGCGADTAIIKCDNVNINDAGVENSGVWSLLLTAINILSAGIGLAVIGGIVYASILYTTAGGNAEQTKKALEFIRNVVIGLFAYAIMFAILEFLIPGGLFAS